MSQIIWYLSLALDVYEVPFLAGQSELVVLLAAGEVGEGPSNPGRSAKDW